MPRKGRPPKRQRRLRGGPPKRKVLKRRPVSAYNRFVGAAMKRGQTMKQAARAWRSKKSGRKRTTVRRTGITSKKRRGAVRRAKPKSTGGRKMAGFNTQKLMKYVRLAALVAPAATTIMQHGASAGSINAVIEKYTGYNGMSGQFSAAKAAEGWSPYLLSVLMTYGVPKLAGIIRGL